MVYSCCFTRRHEGAGVAHEPQTSALLREKANFILSVALKVADIGHVAKVRASFRFY